MHINVLGVGGGLGGLEFANITHCLFFNRSAKRDIHMLADKYTTYVIYVYLYIQFFNIASGSEPKNFRICWGIGFFSLADCHCIDL